jgi:DedD protein
MADAPASLSAEQELKRRGRRRLIGAVTLGLLAFVFIPMFFDSEPRRDADGAKGRTEISVQIPPKDGLPPLPDPAPAAAGAAVNAPSAVMPPAGQPTALHDAADSAAPKAASPSSAPLAAAAAIAKAEPNSALASKAEGKDAARALPKADAPVAAKPSVAKGGFAVQVGAFGDAAKVKEAIDRIKSSGYAHSTQVVAVNNGKVTRVRAGPFASRDAAEAALARIKLNGGDGKIVPLD